nr:MAG TPA: hypothetical protein [Bacteriophage sp.]
MCRLPVICHGAHRGSSRNSLEYPAYQTSSFRV